MTDAVRALLACPACAGPLSAEWSCSGCGTRFDAPDGIPNLRLPGDRRTDVVRQFYEHAPFPGYPARDSLHALRTRAERSEFARLLDAAVPGDARIVEVGCGTGQMCLYLARADRIVIGADITRASLTLGMCAAGRFDLERVQFVETDLRRAALQPGSFDLVYCSGVLHHTPNPRASFERLVQLARPGGILVVGLYNVLARVPFRLRRMIARATGFRVIPFDSVLRDRQNDAERRAAWLRDQYQHPEEHRHTLAEVQDWFRRNGVEYLRTYPSTVFEDEPEDLFTPAPDDWWLEGWLAQLAWMHTLGHEGGLFVTIGRRQAAGGQTGAHPFDAATP